MKQKIIGDLMYLSTILEKEQELLWSLMGVLQSLKIPYSSGLDVDKSRPLVVTMSFEYEKFDRFIAKLEGKKIL